MASSFTPASATHQDMDVELPCIDGLLAGTLALMTGYAEHQCEQGNASRRNLMAKKILSNLHFLVAHPSMPQAMACVMRNLQNHWHTLAALGSLEANAPREPLHTAQATTPASTAPELWMPAHASVQ